MAVKPVHPNRPAQPQDAPQQPQKTKGAVPPQDSGQKASAVAQTKSAKDTVSVGPKRGGPQR